MMSNIFSTKIVLTFLISAIRQEIGRKGTEIEKEGIQCSSIANTVTVYLKNAKGIYR